MYGLGAHEDLLQEVMEKAYRAFGSYRERAGIPISAWLYKIANNHVIDFVRKQKQKLFSLEEGIPGTNTTFKNLFADGADLNAGVGAYEDRLAIALALRHLTPDQIAAVLLRQYHGLSLTEIEVVLGKSIDAIKHLQGRGERNFRTHYRPYNAKIDGADGSQILDESLLGKPLEEVIPVLQEWVGQ